ncbi:MAG TPA: DUF2490 domain-containing protein [Steroidobacteraceae bacterium]|nr:DUF2490 domain-containing protein [Steroidobacteraceae bacterium]
MSRETTKRACAPMRPIASRRPRPGAAFAVIALAAAALPTVGRGGTGEPDEQLWTELDVIAPVATNTTITGIAQLRLSETLPNPILTALGADLNYKIGEWTLGVGYRHEVTGNRQGEEPDITQVLRLPVTWAHRFGRSTVAIRIMPQDTLTASSNPWRLRLRAEYRWATENWGPISYLYTNDEVFYQFSDDEFFRNRFQAGLNLRFGERTGLRLYYQRQDSKNQTPGAINALGVLGVIDFD